MPHGHLEENPGCAVWGFRVGSSCARGELSSMVEERSGQGRSVGFLGRSGQVWSVCLAGMVGFCVGFRRLCRVGLFGRLWWVLVFFPLFVLPAASFGAFSAQTC